MITQKVLTEFFNYNDGFLYWKIKPNKSIIIGNSAGTLRVDGYLATSINKKIYRNHRLIFLMIYGYLPKVVDHINGNISDNRIENLRQATYSQNSMNAKLSLSNVSGIKGVSWASKQNKWLASIKINCKSKHVGYYENIEQAKNAVINFREKNHGEFARNC